MWHNSSAFSSKTLYALDKRSPWKWNLSDFLIIAWKLNKFLISFFKPQVSFPLNFESPFRVITHNSSEIFWLNYYMLWTKRAYQSTIFQTSECSNESSPNSSAIFETTRSGFLQILHHCSVSGKITPLHFFSSNLTYFGQKDPIKVKFSVCWEVGRKITKFLMSYLKPKDSFSLNFASFFNIMIDNSSVLF